ncbi:MAG: RNA 2'-phosphotransferase [Oscillospiraceae bacterium]|nr:RNA 2'-phosphotransferase [Oscillospiraceae bacterium]
MPKKIKDNNSLTNLSKLISLILRHNPQTVGLQLDPDGWVATQALLAGINKTGKYQITMPVLEEVVRIDAKKRYDFNEDHSRIRANYGHSVPVKINYPEKEPPEYLYHGTAERFVDSIREKGILPMNRQYVHLSIDTETASIVGKRHGKLYIFRIPAKEMYRQGHVFYQTYNGIWLADSIPPDFLQDI